MAKHQHTPARDTSAQGRPPSSEGQRNWRHIHHSPLFWAGVVLFLAAISIYVWSDDLAWRPHGR